METRAVGDRDRALTAIQESWNCRHAPSKLALFTGVASFAASISLDAGESSEDALQMLELGRGVISSLLMDMRGDISHLKQHRPALAERFQSEAARRFEAEGELEELLEEIRAQPGFSRFHLPPTTDDFIAAANPDPIVVINLNDFCGAFIISRGQIRVLKLPVLVRNEVKEQVKLLQSSPPTTSLLEWLWDVICHPVLENLGFDKSMTVSDSDWPRIWWVPTGILSQLPLHAAGYHTRYSGETVLDRVMSSYAFSVRSLIHRRRQPLSRSIKLQPDNALLVAMRQTPKKVTLDFADTEVEVLYGICSSLNLNPIKLKELKKESVIQKLKEAKIFHFAGHGESHREDPLKSSLLLQDWETDPLTVKDLLDHKLQENPPFLGFLSACSTGVVENERQVDEGINLINTFQLAGFRHVVGTLWKVQDHQGVEVARIVYETLRDEGMTDLAVCKGLHKAVTALRDKEVASELKRLENMRASRDIDGIEILGESPVYSTKPQYWVPYVHFGV
ncbi:CHAT domain-containing protein [Xylogone sp. PMI_703]|nr:CHAT domain-containing protein [Xylogone sp. PMI_703]